MPLEKSRNDERIASTLNLSRKRNLMKKSRNDESTRNDGSSILFFQKPIV
jgi:hypothetical protein